jgi:hypothetical protein
MASENVLSLNEFQDAQNQIVQGGQLQPMLEANMGSVMPLVNKLPQGVQNVGLGEEE